MASNSSIFSFSLWTDLARAPAARWTWAAALTLGAVALMALSHATLQALLPAAAPVAPDPGGPFPRVDPVHARVLIVGNSTTQVLPARRMTAPTVNRSIAGADYRLTLVQLRHLLPAMPHVRLVLLAFDHRMLRTSAVAQRRGDYRDFYRAGVPWWAVPEVTMLARLNSYLVHGNVLGRLVGSHKLDMCGLDRLLTGGGASVLPHLPARAPVAAPRLDPELTALPWGPRRLRINGRALREIVALCRERGVNLVLIRPPAPEAERIKSAGELDGYLAATRATLPAELVIWDDRDLAGFGPHDFQDQLHLSAEGARRYAKILDERIAALPLDP